MGKGTDKLYITHSEWSSSDGYSASVGANVSSRAQRNGATFRRLPFNFCAASLQPFKNPVCTADGTIFDVEVISAWLEKRHTNPVNGEPLAAKDLIRLNFARNSDASADSANGNPTDGKGDLIDPVTFKVFTDNTHIVAIRHGSYANVFAWDTVERMNIKAKMWRDLVDDVEFARKDIITLQDPQSTAGRDLSQFKYLKDGEDALLTKEQEEERMAGNVNIDALGRMGDKVLRAKEAVERARREREAGGDVNRQSGALTKTPNPTARRQDVTRQQNVARQAAYTTGKAAASFTSTGLTPETSGERAQISEEDWMLRPKVVKEKGYARMETNLGDLLILLHTDTAPKAVWNFTRLSQKGYYKGMAFHRNIPNFMIQGGDPTGTGKGGTSIWGKNFQDEFEGPLKHSDRGILSMANKGPNTNSSQFFITYRATPHLNRKHTIFGRVYDGMDVLAKMEETPTDGSDRPLNKIVIKNVVIFLDPFEEFLKKKKQTETVEEQKAEIQRRGGTEDDRTTWTGKRLRDGEAAADATAEDVGKYLRVPVSQLVNEAKAAEEPATWEEPSKKKAKTGGFGNFDSW